MLVLLLMRQNYPDYLNSIEKCEVEKRHLTFFVCVYSWPTISRYTVSGTYHAATISRQTRTKPPMIPARMKFSANRAIPLPRGAAARCRTAARRVSITIGSPVHRFSRKRTGRCNTAARRPPRAGSSCNRNPLSLRLL